MPVLLILALLSACASVPPCPIAKTPDGTRVVEVSDERVLLDGARVGATELDIALLDHVKGMHSSGLASLRQCMRGSAAAVRVVSTDRVRGIAFVEVIDDLRHAGVDEWTWVHEGEEVGAFRMNDGSEDRVLVMVDVAKPIIGLAAELRPSLGRAIEWVGHFARTD